jgi:hypothetical protein
MGLSSLTANAGTIVRTLTGFSPTSICNVDQEYDHGARSSNGESGLAQAMRVHTQSRNADRRRLGIFSVGFIYPFFAHSVVPLDAEMLAVPFHQWS